MVRYGKSRGLGGALLAALLAGGVAVAVGESFEATGDLDGGGRSSHAAALLPDGRVLVAGGFSSAAGNETASAETWDPDTGAWTTTASMANARQLLTANQLPDGRVMVAGGIDSGTVYASTQLFDPDTETFSAGASMNTARCAHTTVDLPDGRVLAVGGLGASNNGLAAAEVYDPDDDAWTATGSMANARLHFPAVALDDGRVLVVGGAAGPEGSFASLSTCEIWNPGSGAWSAAASLSAGRTAAAAALLPDGRVLVLGGHNGSTSYGDALIYDPDTNSWSIEATGLAARAHATLIALPDGRYLLAGGVSLPSQVPLTSAALYDPGTGNFTALPSMVEGRVNHAAVLLDDGRVLFAGGSIVISAGIGGQTDSAELFVPGDDGDTTPPTIEDAVADRTMLWPPNHKMVAVTLDATVADDGGGATTLHIASVTSNEPVDGDGDGGSSPDWEITGDLTVKLRAERGGSGTGRVYTITLVATDAAGNETEATVLVTVPKSRN